MARQTSTITVTRRLGNIVGMKGLDGAYNARVYVPAEEINDSKTPLQVMQRAKFALGTKVAGMLGVLGEQVLYANGLSPNRRGKLVQQILAAITYSENKAMLTGDLPLVISPKTTVELQDRSLRLTAPTAEASGSFAYTFKPVVGNGAYVRSIVAMLCYDRSAGTWNSQVIISSETSFTARMYISSAYAGHKADVYCYSLVGANVTRLGQATADMGSMNSDEGAGYAIPVTESGMTTADLGYAQVDSYHMTFDVPAIIGG